MATAAATATEEKRIADIIRGREELMALSSGGRSLKRLAGSEDLYALRTKGAQVDDEGEGETAATAVDEKKLLVSCTITTQDEDRARDVIVTAGIDLSNHRETRTVLYDHGLSRSVDFPIGTATDADDNYSVKIEKGRARAVTKFSQSLLEAEQIFQLIAEGVLRGVSVGVRVKSCEYRRDQSPDEYCGWPGLLISECELFEYSHTAIPQNPKALADKVKSGNGVLAGRRVSEALYKSFLPHLPEPRALVVSGYQAVAEPEKAKAATATTVEPIKQQGAAAVVGGGGDEDMQQQQQQQQPMGAVALGRAFDRLIELGECIARDSLKQENPRVAAELDGLAALADDQCETILATYSSEYPDLPPLCPPDFSSPQMPQGEEEEARNDRVPPSVRRLADRAAAVKKALAEIDARRTADAVGGLPAHDKAACLKAAALLGELTASLPSAGAGGSQKSLAELLIERLKVIAETKAVSPASSGESEEIRALKARNADLAEKLKSSVTANEKLAREVRRALNGAGRH